ncbi:MAG: UbiA family prenyltransferase [Pirellulales bacterium]
MARVLSYLKLLRAPNGFTAIADICMGFLLASVMTLGVLGIGSSRAPLGAFVALAVASWCLYSAGMVLNDVFDFSIDQQERPQRPLPSGQIPLSQARLLGFGLLLLGIVWGALPGYLYSRESGMPWRTGLMALLLALAVLAYDGGLKKTWFGPVSMGLCRFLNVLLGMSLVAVPQGEAFSFLGYGPVHFLPAAGIGIYIVGVTWFARQEAGISARTGLIGGGIVMALGISLLFCTVQWVPMPRLEPKWFGLLLILLSLSIAKRVLAAVTNPEGKQVQAAVKHAIFSLVMFDAAVCVLVAPWHYGVAVLALLFPMMWLGRWIYST